MTTLGRFRALGAIGATYYVVTLMEGMDPYSWSQSDPALKLNMTGVQRGDDGSSNQWIFACAADPSTVEQLLLQDPRVVSAVLMGGESADVLAVGDVSYVAESRPEPGKPEYSLPGYIPKLPNDATKSLSVQDQAAAASVPETMQAPAPAPAASGLPWWLLLAVGWALTRR